MRLLTLVYVYLKKDQALESTGLNLVSTIDVTVVRTLMLRKNNRMCLRFVNNISCLKCV